MPFVGPDVGGFGGSTTEPLMIDWMKACFLFPFSRNHTVAGSRSQEPWQFSAHALEVLRRFVRLRYKLLPYLYNLFIEHEETGEAIMRPLFYDFDDATGQPLGKIDDQFMVGGFLMQAPFVTEADATRRVVLPRAAWFRADSGEWVRGGRTLSVDRSRDSTPVFIREGAMMPMQRGECETNRKDLLAIDLHLYLRPGSTMAASARYAADDGETYRYRFGERSDYAISARVTGRSLRLEIATRAEKHGAVLFGPVTPTLFDRLVVVRNGIETALLPSPGPTPWPGAGGPLYYWKTDRR
jgi:alpha-glucosidase